MTHQTLPRPQSLSQAQPQPPDPTGAARRLFLGYLSETDARPSLQALQDLFRGLINAQAQLLHQRPESALAAAQLALEEVRLDLVRERARSGQRIGFASGRIDKRPLVRG